MAESKKYLDKLGVKHLWKAIELRDKSVKLVYDSSNKKIKLSYNGVVDEFNTIDATPFIKDGMLEDVSVVIAGPSNQITYGNRIYQNGEKFIKFVWNVSGNNKVDFIKTDEIGATYEGTDSILIDSLNKISVKNVDAKKTTIKHNIPVTGGPLGKFAKSVYPNGIPAGESMEDILLNLFSGEEKPEPPTPETEVWPTNIQYEQASLSSEVDAPVIEMSEEMVEVGSVVPYTIKNGASRVLATPHKVTGLAYGYSLSDNNIKEYTETELIANFNSPSIREDLSVLTVTGSVENTKTGTHEAGSAVITGSIVAKAGENIINASNDSAVYSGVCEGLSPVYICSDKDHTNSSHMTTQMDRVELITQKSIASSSKKFIGANKYYMGCYSDAVYEEKVYTSTSIRETDLKTTGWVNGIEVDAEIKTTPNTKGVYIAIPMGLDDNGDNLSIVQTTAFGLEVSADFIKNQRTITLPSGEYKVFTWSFPDGTAGVEKFHITKF